MKVIEWILLTTCSVVVVIGAGLFCWNLQVSDAENPDLAGLITIGALASALGLTLIVKILPIVLSMEETIDNIQNTIENR